MQRRACLTWAAALAASAVSLTMRTPRAWATGRLPVGGRIAVHLPWPIATIDPDTINGFPIITNPDMPLMAAGAKSILFGDFSTYVVRDLPALTIYRFNDSAYATKGQIGFLGIARAGGTYTDTGTAIRAYQNSAT